MSDLKRIFDCLDNSKIEQKEFAALLGVNPSAISQWRTGRSKSYTKYLPQIAEALGTTVEYLLTGKEEQVAEPSTDEAILLRQYRNLNQEGKEKALEYMFDLVATGRYKKPSQFDLGAKEA